jgi:hypothetical protein
MDVQRWLSHYARARLAVVFLAIAAIFIVAATARAQEGFEVRVEQYESPRPGTFLFEQHGTFVGTGNRDSADAVAPTHHQLRFTSELTVPITLHFSLGTMVLTAVRPGHIAPEYAGARVIPHLYAPESWNLPVKLGLTAEFSWSNERYAERTPNIELKPVIEKEFGRFQLDLNPSIEGALYRGSHWNFEPSLRFAYRSSRSLSPGLEYYSELGSLSGLLPSSEQTHQIYPTVDWTLNTNVHWHFGIGLGLTPAGDQLVYKTRIEVSLGRKTR